MNFMCQINALIYIRVPFYFETKPTAKALN